MREGLFSSSGSVANSILSNLIFTILKFTILNVNLLELQPFHEVIPYIALDDNLS
jgi:hypothetical protein